jgi:hypothetical protein
MDKTISLDDMREIVGKAIFGSDWIGGLSDQDWKLITGEFGIKRRDRTGVDGIFKSPVIKRCPPYSAPKLDRAIGRAARADAQYSTVDAWIVDHGLPLSPTELARREAFDHLLREFERQSAPPARKRGPQTGILERVMADMRSVPRDELDAMAEKELEHRFGAKRERCREARRRVLAEQDAK